MALESASFIAQLVAANPIGQGPKSEGDNHLRMIKACLQASLPGLAGRFGRVLSKSANYTAVLNDNFSTISGTGIWTLALAPAATLGNGWMLIVLNNGVGGITVDPDGTELVNGLTTLVLPPGQCGILLCNGAAFSLLMFDNGRAHAQGTDIPSATAIDLDVVAGDLVDVTGSTDIETITLAVGRTVKVRFTEKLNLIRSANLVLIDGQNIETAFGDFAEFRGYGGGVTVLTNYHRADGRPLFVGGIGIASIIEQATTSGTGFDFLNIPPWVKRFLLMFVGVSLNGSDDLLVQIGTGGVPETSSYASNSVIAINAAGTEGALSSSGFLFAISNASGFCHGHMLLSRIGVSNKWVASHSGRVLAIGAASGGGSKTLAGPLDMVRLTRTGGNLFDSGSVAAIYD